jgi:hypothetical protein
MRLTRIKYALRGTVYIRISKSRAVQGNKESGSRGRTMKPISPLSSINDIDINEVKL